MYLTVLHNVELC